MQAVNKQRFVGRFSLSAEWPLQRCNSSFCPNSCFSQKHAIVNPRTGRRNDATAHIDLRIACCKAQQLILPPESTVARRNSSY